jgi:hypothetical protein
VLLDKKTKLLATLRYLAGGVMWDICMAYKIGLEIGVVPE